MPHISLDLNAKGVNPVIVNADYKIEKIVLHENIADVSFSISIPNAENALKALDSTTWGAHKLILEVDEKSTETTLTVGNLRINSKILYNLLSNNLLQKTLSNNIDPQLKRGFTVEEQINLNSAVKFDQNTMEFSKTVRYTTGVVSSSSPYNRQITSNNVPFISFLHCALKDCLQDKDAAPGTVPPEFKQFYNKDSMQLIMLGYLLHFQAQCESNKIPLILSIDLNKDLANLRERMLHHLDNLLRKPTFNYERTPLLDHTKVNTAPPPMDESKLTPGL